MRLSAKISLSLFGITLGILTVFALDMLFNGGSMVAHAIHRRVPECSSACHGQVHGDLGLTVRADMALLHQVFAAEAATQRLGQPVIEPVLDEAGSIVNQTDIDTDSAERADAQSVVDAASPEVMECVLAKNPIQEPAP